jgi:hypothetical protein
VNAASDTVRIQAGNSGSSIRPRACGTIISTSSPSAYRAGEHDGQCRPLLNNVATRQDHRFRVERVEDRLDQEDVRAAVNKTVQVGLKELVSVSDQPWPARLLPVVVSGDFTLRRA